MNPSYRRFTRWATVVWAGLLAGVVWLAFAGPCSGPDSGTDGGTAGGLVACNSEMGVEERARREISQSLF